MRSPLKDAATAWFSARAKLTNGLRGASWVFPATGWRPITKSPRATPETLLPHETILPDLLTAGAVDSAMTSKTKASVLRDLVALAEKTGQLNDPKTLVDSLEAREELCSTAMPGGFALPHLRTQEPYLFETSFLVVGRPIQPIHFGAPDGEPTQLFFLICCQDDRLHLHIAGPAVSDGDEDRGARSAPRRIRCPSHARRAHRRRSRRF
jgi:mannitol/fructose-specific phosphotransferase system IIA component (Ntr-type)